MYKDSKKHIQEELAALGSKLPGRGQIHDFTTPEGYFDELPQVIKKRIDNARPSIWDSAAASFINKWAYALAAMVVLVIGVSGFLFIRQASYNDQQLVFDDALSMECLTLYAALEPFALYELVFESGLSTEEIQYGLDGQYLYDDQGILLEYLDEMHAYYGLDANEFLDTKAGTESDKD